MWSPFSTATRGFCRGAHSTCVCVCACVCMSACVSVCACVRVCVQVCVCPLSPPPSVSLCLSLCLSVCLSLSLSLSLCACACAHVPCVCAADTHVIERKRAVLVSVQRDCAPWDRFQFVHLLPIPPDNQCQGGLCVEQATIALPQLVNSPRHHNTARRHATHHAVRTRGAVMAAGKRPDADVTATVPLCCSAAVGRYELATPSAVAVLQPTVGLP